MKFQDIDLCVLSRKSGGTVSEYKYLEHGAMWSVGFLAISMIIQIFMHLPHGLIIAFAIIPIAIAFYHSVRENKLDNLTVN